MTIPACAKAGRYDMEDGFRPGPIRRPVLARKGFFVDFFLENLVETLAIVTVILIVSAVVIIFLSER